MDAATILTGRPAAPAPRLLRAGPVLVELDGADLRAVRVGDAELVQRVYMAVRDAPWNTIPGVFSDWSVREDDDAFLVTFAARHMHDYGTTREQLASVAVAARQWAKLNPAAADRRPPAGWPALR